MWKEAVCLVAKTLLLVQVKASPDISLEDLLERLVTLEDWKRATEYEVSSLRGTVNQQGVIIKNLERELAIQANLTATLQAYNQDNHDNKQDTRDHTVEAEEDRDNKNTREHEVEAEEDRDNKNTRDHTVEAEEDRDNKNTREQEVQAAEDQEDDGDISDTSNRIRSTDDANQVAVKPSTLNKRATSGGVAFTAYLDHDVILDSKQKIKFNQIITNDGDGYNVRTGAFTCQEAGVYLFTFSIGERGTSDNIQQLLAELVVNNQLIVGAIVETRFMYQDLQGGNTAVVRLNAGDAVWVEGKNDREHIEGSGNNQLSTFTGVYLYA